MPTSPLEVNGQRGIRQRASHSQYSPTVFLAGLSTEHSLRARHTAMITQNAYFEPASSPRAQAVPSCDVIVWGPLQLALHNKREDAQWLEK